MKEERPFNQSDFQYFSTKGDDLYWKGKKLKRAGLSTAEKIAITTFIIGGLLTLFINLEKVEDNLNLARSYICNNIHHFSYCSTLVDKSLPTKPDKIN